MAEQNNQVRLKNFNRRTVLNCIRKTGTASKAGLASITGLTFMAIKKILEELEELELIRNDIMESGGLGRKALTYAVNENYRYTIGIHINKFSTGVALMNLRGQIKEIKSFSVERECTTQYEFAEKLTGVVEEVIAAADIKRNLILGIGVGAPGPLDCERGIILTPPNMPMLNYLPLKEILEESTGFSVYVNKDTNVIAFGEYWYGNHLESNNLSYIDVDMGIGSGLIMDGKMNVGANSIAGEFGHITLDINGPLCNCGNKGCLEAMSSGIAIVKELSEKLEKEEKHPLYEKRKSLIIEDVFAMAARKDLLTISILNKAAFYVGVAVSNLINILDPQMIILGGILIQRYEPFFSIVQDIANARKVNGAKQNVLAVSSLKERAGVVGAGEIVADYFFHEKVNEVFIKN